MRSQDSVDNEGIGPVETISWGTMFPDVVAARPEASEELLARRRAVRDHCRVQRATSTASVLSEADPADLAHAAALIAQARELLEARQRTADTSPEVDDALIGVRMYFPLCGEGSPLWDPVTFVRDGDEIRARCRFGPANEGPPGNLHGGIAAMLMDTALGHTVAGLGAPGLTARLDISYHRPVPLNEDLEVRGRITSQVDHSVVAEAWIVRAADPEQRLVSADGHFRQLDPKRAQRFIAVD